MSKVFLFKENNSKDRDCVYYIENNPLRFECGHYFGKVNLEGACFSMGLNSLEKIDLDNITTILSKEELQELIKFDKELNNLGYGINKGDERYKEGIRLCNNVMHIYNKLNSEENDIIFNKVVQEEMDYIAYQYNIGRRKDIEEIFDNYGLDYRDRGIVSAIYEEPEELGRDEAYALGYVESGSFIEKYFDFESFGEDLIDGERYYELEFGRLVVYNY